MRRWQRERERIEGSEKGKKQVREKKEKENE